MHCGPSNLNLGIFVGIFVCSFDVCGASHAQPFPFTNYVAKEWLFPLVIDFCDYQDRYPGNDWVINGVTTFTFCFRVSIELQVKQHEEAYSSSSSFVSVQFLINGTKILHVSFVCTISNIASGVNFRGENLCGNLFLPTVKKKPP